MQETTQAERVLSRRTVLRVGVLGAVSLASIPLLAACGGGAAPSTSGTPAAVAAAQPTTALAKPTAVASTQSSAAPTVAKPAQATAAATSAASPAAQAPVQSGQVVTMNYLHFFTGVLWTGGFQQLVAQFEKENPTIKWNGIATPYGQMMPKLITLAAGGQPPDGTSMDNTEIDDVALRGLLKDLDPYVSADKTINMDDFYKARLDEQRWRGKLYGMPIDMGSSAIYYNKDAFDQAGLTYPDPKWTWNDVFSQAAKLTIDKGGKHPGESGFDPSNVRQWGFNYDNSIYRFYNAYRGYNGAEYFDQQLTKTRFNEPEGIASMQRFADLTNKDHVSPSPAENTAMQAGGVQPFTSGQYAMDFQWIGLIAYLHQPGVKVTNWDVVNLPESPTAAQEVGGQGFVVVDKSPHPDAAWAFTKYMVGDEAQKYLGVNGVWFPSRKSMAQYGWPTDHKPANFVAAFYDQVDKHGVACWWFVPGWNQWQQMIVNETDALWIGRRDAKDTAAAIQQKIDPLVANWQKNLQQ